jgi:hypothetical protein
MRCPCMYYVNSLPLAVLSQTHFIRRTASAHINSVDTTNKSTVSTRHHHDILAVVAHGTAINVKALHRALLVEVLVSAESSIPSKFQQEICRDGERFERVCRDIC